MTAAPATPRLRRRLFLYLARIGRLWRALHWAWLLLLLAVPPFEAAFRAAAGVPPDLANLEPWRYSIAAFEGEALRYALRRTAGAAPLPAPRARRARIRAYMQDKREMQAAARQFGEASRMLEPFALLRMAHAQQQWQQAQTRINRAQADFERAVQAEVADELARLGLIARQAPFPPIWFRLAEPPLLLTLSPRHAIRSVASLYVRTAAPAHEIEAYEEEAQATWNLSAYVSPTGGVSTFPATVMQRFPDLETLFDVVAHEWLHNYLAFRPLGLRYFRSTAHRTLNETAASLFGQAVATRIMLRHYRDLRPLPAADAAGPEAFDFRAFMRATRLRTDALLAQGRIPEAEAYMEARRRVVKAQGYNLRKLNQAYFAFHGTYATAPGSSSPIGPQMEELLRLEPDPGAFVRTVRSFRNAEDLRTALRQRRAPVRPPADRDA